MLLFFVAAGINHFRNPNFYAPMMPPYLPATKALIYISGFFEILGGIGVALPSLGKAAGWGLIALLIAVIPAHIHMLMNPESFDTVPFWVLIVRMPMQAVLIAWVWWTALREEARRRFPQSLS
tara:strand:- start:122 stop:490 length:369 start_codon:yes stop_codon:yes gene_type:complete